MPRSLMGPPPTLTVCQPLFCSAVTRCTRGGCDHFAAEADAVRNAGGRVALLDHDELLDGEADIAVNGVPADLGPL